MAKKDVTTFIMNRLAYNQDRDELELNGKSVGTGQLLELSVMGYWLPGVVHRDGSGWYLLTRDQVGIRLAAGLRARILDIALTLPPSASIKHNERLSPNEVSHTLQQS